MSNDINTFYKDKFTKFDKIIRFTVPGKPQGKARARTFYNEKLGRMQSVTPENTVLYENLIKQCCLEAMQKDEVSGFFDGEALVVTIDAYFDVPKSVSKKKKRLMNIGVIRPTKKPDADNIAKVVCDALNGIAYTDDTQIIRLGVRKSYVETHDEAVPPEYLFETPCVNVTIYQQVQCIHKG